MGAPAASPPSSSPTRDKPPEAVAALRSQSTDLEAATTPRPTIPSATGQTPDADKPEGATDRLDEEHITEDVPGGEAAQGAAGADRGTGDGDEEVLRRRPRGAPRVRVSFLYYSADPARRRVMVTVADGALVTLTEGQSVESLVVARILPDEVHFRYEGNVFAVLPRY
jgi:hypothetical protein